MPFLPGADNRALIANMRASFLGTNVPDLVSRLPAPVRELSSEKKNGRERRDPRYAPGSGTHSAPQRVKQVN